MRTQIGARTSQDRSQGDKRRVDHDRIEAAGKRIVGKVAKIGSLDDRYARIVAQSPIELTVSDINGSNVLGSALQEAIGETASRRTNVERFQTGYVERKKLERAIQLLSTPAHET